MGPAGPKNREQEWRLARSKAFPFRGRWQPEGLTEEVVLLEEISQTVDTAGGPTSSDPALRPAHLPLKGKAFGCGSRHSCSLFPVPLSPRQIRSYPTEQLPCF